MTHYLNTRIVAFRSVPRSKKPETVTIASVMDHSWSKPEHVGTEGFTQIARGQIDKLVDVYRNGHLPPKDSVIEDGDQISATHLSLIVEEMKSGRIKQQSVTLHTNQAGKVVLQILLE